jgi:hypothetical protein
VDVTLTALCHLNSFHFAAIIHKDDEPHEYMKVSPSTRYLTLEKTRHSDTAMLCEWHRDGTRVNHGAGHAPELEKFKEALFDRLEVGESR